MKLPLGQWDWVRGARILYTNVSITCLVKEDNWQRTLKMCSRRAKKKVLANVWWMETFKNGFLKICFSLALFSCKVSFYRKVFHVYVWWMKPPLLVSPRIFFFLFTQVKTAKRRRKLAVIAAPNRQVALRHLYRTKINNRTQRRLTHSTKPLNH